MIQIWVLSCLRYFNTDAFTVSNNTQTLGIYIPVQIRLPKPCPRKKLTTMSVCNSCHITVLVTTSSIHILKMLPLMLKWFYNTVTLYQGFWYTSVHVPVTYLNKVLLCIMDLKLVLCNKGMRMKVLSLLRPEIDSIITA